MSPFRIPLAVLALILAGCYTGEGSGRVVVERFDVGEFTEVVLSGDGRVIIAPGEHAVSVSAEDDIVPSLNVVVDGKRLVLQREVDWIDGIRPTVPIQFRVTMPMLEGVRVSGSAIATVRGVPFADEATLATSGVASIDAAPVVCGHLVAEVDGAGEMLVSGVAGATFRGAVGGLGRITALGEVDEVEVVVTGSGLFRGSGLLGASIRAEVGGVGQAFVWAERRLDADVGGDGRLVYRGDPVVEGRVGEDDRITRMESPPTLPGG
ncbi:MAG: DUF2807 domain-containing protein [Gammaproteobacteria bacterium]|nr:DUF2807 domain-containing protein [Gammaproteobacteria bacterium]MDE0440735.1 DUF2807 domain-containing protein [Gammaproteobacteria bacterium]